MPEKARSSAGEVKTSGRIDWEKAAERLAAVLPLRLLHPEFLAWTAGRSAAARGPWAVAFSGGADSLALLLLVWHHWPQRRDRLTALHFDHRLRGVESRGDAAFCARVCRGLSLTLETGVWKRRRSGSVSEASAREARMAFFGGCMDRLGARALLLGHQTEDVAESMLMRLSRGSGTAGLAAPRPIQVMPDRTVRIRPMLALGRHQIREALAGAGIPWREDSSNAEGLYLRNRMRHEVLPAWISASSGRDAPAGAALSRELLAEDDEALESWLDELCALGPGAHLHLTKLHEKPKALWRRALRRWLSATPYRGDLSRQGFQALLEACIQGKATRQSLGSEGFAVVRQGQLSFSRERSKAPDIAAL